MGLADLGGSRRSLSPDPGWRTAVGSRCSACSSRCWRYKVVGFGGFVRAGILFEGSGMGAVLYTYFLCFGCHLELGDEQLDFVGFLSF